MPTGVWSKVRYSLLRKTSGSATVDVPVVVYLEPTDRTDWQVERLIALVYLVIGLFVLLRRWTAPKSTHFFVFCLVSFMLYAFKFTGILDGLRHNDSDWEHYCDGAAAGAVPALRDQLYAGGDRGGGAGCCTR